MKRHSKQKSSGINLDELYSAIRRAWTRESSADPEHWSDTNPAWGQCAVTALIVQDHFGGTFLRTKVRGISHYWNLLGNDTEIDLTKEQFGEDFEPGEIESRSRSWILSFPDTETRYNLLRAEALKDLERGSETDDIAQ